jgi:thymidylate kinase
MQMGFSTRYQEADPIEVLSYLQDNAETLVSDLKDEFERELYRRKGFNGFMRLKYEDNIKQKIKNKIRQLFLEQFNLNAEAAYVIECDEKIESITNKIIKEILCQ